VTVRVALLSAFTFAAVAAASGAAPRLDYANVSLSILAPGENGSVAFDRHTNDQVRLYDALTPLQDAVTDRVLRTYFKPAMFAARGKSEAIGRRGVRIVRDAFGVAHVTGKTRADVFYAAGWIAVEDRGLLMDLLRSAGRLSAIDAPGYNAFAVALTGRRFESSAQTEAFLGSQFALVRALGAPGRRAIADIDAYVAGINAYNKAKGLPSAPWVRNDVIAVATVLAARFGAGGGDEARRSQLLDALRRQLGKEKGDQVWNDLAELEDPESPVAVSGRFAYSATRSLDAPGSVVVDADSFAPPPLALHVGASNALLIGSSRSATGHPLFVAGPQVGYYFPEVFLEYDLHGGGVDVRGAAVPGVPWVVVGRGKDFVWSPTTSNSDIVDTYVETLCGGDDVHYLYKGECRTMTTFDAGVLKGSPGKPDDRVAFRETVHGPVFGYATAGGVRVALSQRRSTRERELVSVGTFMRLNENEPRSGRDFVRLMNGIELGFNWHYADSRDIAFFSSARLPLRPAGVDSQLPTRGTGEYEWTGFAPASAHPQGVNPPSGVIVNWNQRPARGFGAADDNWAFGSVHRVDLLARNLALRKKHTLGSVVAAMNKAATQDLRAVRVWPVIADVLKTGTAPSAGAQQLADLVTAWSAKGASRLDRDLDGKVDDPAAAILDAAWPRLAEAVLSPVLGPLTARLAELIEPDHAPNAGGSAYFSGWYGYVDKDLRALLGRPVTAPFATKFCGAGDLAACRTSLWSAIEGAAAELVATQGPDPTAWRADATKERIRFAPGILTDTMRWSNRPTFQQVATFTAHR
jgi:acyl-homoserine lactone acylase PvdQ